MAQSTLIRPEVLIVSTLAFLSGGLAGAVFTWLMNRPEPTILTYNSSATLTGEKAVKSAVPKLKVQIGSEEIPSLYSHSVELSLFRGPYLDTATIAVTFPQDVRIFGFAGEAPSPLHTISCLPINGGARCDLSPINETQNGKYRITVATDKGTPPQVMTATKSLKLFRLDEFASNQTFSDLFSREQLPKTLGASTFALVYACVLVYALFKLKGAFRNRFRPLIVGKILDATGRPIKGADVQLALTSPKVNYTPTETDSYGDFILGGASKRSRRGDGGKNGRFIRKRIYAR